MISVCIATYNGEKFIKEQIASILVQLHANDEIIISDNGSTDNTLKIISEFIDERIKVFHYDINKDLIRNFENALNKCNGDYIFLSDQDDFWMAEKVSRMMSFLYSNDVVICDCQLINEEGNMFESSFYKINGSKKGFFHNLTHNSYLGCCLGFRRDVLKLALPFPLDIPMHDIWIGFVAEIFFKPVFIDDQLLKYRRHGDNASSSSEKSRSNFWTKISYRFNLIKYLPLLFIRYFKVKTKKVPST